MRFSRSFANSLLGKTVAASISSLLRGSGHHNLIRREMFNEQYLEALDGISFVTDLEGTITGIAPSNWNAFAAANDALELLDERVIGQNLFAFVSGRDVKSALQHIMKRVATGVHNRWAMEFRCDGPRCRRIMRQSITPVRESNTCIAFLFQSIELSTEERPMIDIFDFGEVERQAQQNPNLPTIAICSWCKRVRQDATSGTCWVEAEDYYAAGGRSRVRISHSICEDCFKTASDY